MNLNLTKLMNIRVEIKAFFECVCFHPGKLIFICTYWSSLNTIFGASRIELKLTSLPAWSLQCFHAQFCWMTEIALRCVTFEHRQKEICAESIDEFICNLFNFSASFFVIANTEEQVSNSMVIDCMRFLEIS